MKETLSQTIRKGNSTPAEDAMADAAPALLEACKALVEHHDDYDYENPRSFTDIVNKARAAIALAGGE